MQGDVTGHPFRIENSPSPPSCLIKPLPIYGFKTAGFCILDNTDIQKSSVTTNLLTGIDFYSS